jgi:hypothetical protein
MTLPISVKQFFSDPVKSILFLAVTAIMYLYIDNKMVYLDRIQKQETRIIDLEKKVEGLQERIIKITMNHDGH